MKKLPLLLSLFVASKLMFAQSPEVIRNYIATYKEIAIEEMQRTGVPAAITLAQGIHETGAGQSELVRKSNNHFGIKCKSDWTGESVSHDDDAKGECFRKYDNPFDSYRDHSDFLKNRPYYASLFKLDPTDYEGWAYGLKKAGYATNPRYAQILIKLIRDYDLEDYTLIALGRKNDNSDVVLASNTHQNESSSHTKTVAAVQTGTIAAAHYPSGIFKINETKVLLVPSGTSYLKVAEENGLSLARLFEFNDIHAALDIAQVDQLIFLQRKRKKGATEFHLVANGETLYEIAQKEGIRMESLLAYNFLRAEMQPKTGEKLYMQQQAPARPALSGEQINATASVHAMPAKTALDAQQILHTVQPKETVYAIAKKYDVAVADVLKWNDMQTATLKTGQQLRITKRTANAN